MMDPSRAVKDSDFRTGDFCKSEGEGYKK
jgi:hypothetical protein